MNEQAEQTDLYLIQQKSDAIRAFRLHVGESLVGRHSASDICLPYAAVSRKHARLQVTPSRVEVQDLDSHNGTFINENRVKQGPLGVGERVRFGSETLYLSRDPSGDSDDASDESTRTILQSRLTAGQLRVFQLLITGISEKQIAKELKLSVHTVHNHIREIYRVFNVHSRSELMRRVFRLPEEMGPEG